MMRPTDIMAPKSRELYENSLEKILLGKDIPDFAEFQIYAKNRKRLWIRINMHNKYKNGMIVKSTVVAHDITAQKKAENELKTYRNHLEEMIQERTSELIQANSRLQMEVAERKQAEKELRYREYELKRKTSNLEELNSALRILLKKRDSDRAEVEDNVLHNVKKMISPYLGKLKMSNLDKKQEAFLGIVESNINEIVSPFSTTLAKQYQSLTPAEIQVANMVRQGLTTKEMALLLNLSIRTIESYRASIRRKMGLTNKKISLRSYLITLK